MQKLLLPVPCTQDAKRARALLKAVRQRVAEGKITSYADLVRESLNALEQVFTGLSEPITQNRVLTGHRDPEVLNLLARETREDLEALFGTAGEVNTAVVSSFNYTSTLVARLTARIRRAASRGQDLQHVTGVFSEDTITVGDNFVDNSRVDPSVQIGSDEADVLAGTGCMLHRTSVAPVTDEAEIVVLSNREVYEGKFYALDGEAEPEGGEFHFSKTKGNKNVMSNPGLQPDPGSQTLSEPSETDPESLLTAAETDSGADLEAKNKIRARILDGNPDTYWQAEYVVGIPDINQSELTYQQLVDALAQPGLDAIDLEVTLVLKLKSPQTVNFIVLDPLQAGDGAWMEVTDISMCLDGTSWETIEGLHDHNYENVLTDEANEELTAEEVGITLAPNKYEYIGNGVWTFPAVEARYLRVTLLQRVAVPAPYDILAFETSQTLTTTHRGHKGTSTSCDELREVQRMNYMDTLRIRAGRGVRPGLRPGLSMENSYGQSAINIVQDIFDPGRFLHSKEPRAQTGHELSPAITVDEWTETVWDKARYAIGIRDLRAFSYQFSAFSERGSVRYLSPKPITKVTLQTDELIPREFNLTGHVRPWILYWVSFDDGDTWVALSPVSSSALNRLDGAILPAAVNLNSGIPREEQDPLQAYVDIENPRSVRLKWRLERPSGKSDRTPILKGYRLHLSVEGGLS